MSKPPSFCDPTRNPIYGMLEDLLRELDRIKKELEALDLDNVADKIANDLRKELEARLSDIEEKILRIEQAIADIDIDQLVRDIEESILEQLDPIRIQIEEIQNQLETLKLGLTISEAWSWSKDGSDRFTTIYPRENIALWPEGGFSQDTTNAYGYWRATWMDDYRTLSLRAHNSGNLNGNSVRYRYRDQDNALVYPEGPVWRLYQGRMLLDGEPFKKEYFQTSGSGVNSVPRLNINRSSQARFLRFEIDEDGNFEACEGILSSNSDIFYISLSLSHSEMIGRTITFENLKIEDILVPEGETLQTFQGPVEKSIYTPRTWVDPENALPPYHAFAIQRFEDPKMYTRFEYTSEAIDFMEQRKNEKINDLGQRISELESKG